VSRVLGHIRQSVEEGRRDDSAEEQVQHAVTQQTTCRGVRGGEATATGYRLVVTLHRSIPPTPPLHPSHTPPPSVTSTLRCYTTDNM